MARAHMSALILVIACWLNCIQQANGIQLLGHLNFPDDTSTKWIAVSNYETEAYPFQLWISQQYVYAVIINVEAQNISLSFSSKIPSQYQPEAALLSSAGLDGGMARFLVITTANPTKLLEVQVKNGTWKTVQSMNINGLTGTPSWRIMLPIEAQVSLSTVYIFALDFVFSLDYPDWQQIDHVNITTSIGNAYPITDVTGAGVSELQMELYMARAGIPTKPGELVLFRLSDLNGQFSFGQVTYLDQSPDNFLINTGGEAADLYWTQTKPSLGVLYKYILGGGGRKSFTNTTTPFQSGEFFGKARAIDMQGQYALYCSGSGNQGYMLRRAQIMQGLKFDQTLKVSGSQVPQLGLDVNGEIDGNAVFGTFTSEGVAQLTLISYGPQ